jgi:P27 family predicted phage terminase small subunit
MAKPGPRPTPTKLRVLRGETRPSRLNANEPKVAGGEIRPVLPLSDAGVVVWNSVVATLGPSGLLTPADALLLAAFCEHYAMHFEMIWHLRAIAVKDAAYLVPGRHGNQSEMVKNPLVGMIKNEATLIRQYGVEFGLSPSSRSGLVVAGETSSELEQLLS